ncbi:MAG: hypothetical protein IKR78_01300 [Dehalococcoidales bacterium]|nr:hypothetical protein [Dehalococcoidales bacterium]
MIDISADWSMVIITTIYALTTIIICIFNAMNNSTVKKQAIASNEHQHQNAGIQLYSLRKEVLVALDRKKFDDIYWDVALLFNADINKQFMELADAAHKLDSLNADLAFYERFLINNMESNDYASFKLASGKSSKEAYADCAKLLGTYDKSVSISVDGETKDLNYRDLLENKHKYGIQVDSMRLNLSIKMQQFIKDSIK